VLLHIRAPAEIRHSWWVRVDFQHLWRNQKPPLRPGVDRFPRRWLVAASMAMVVAHVSSEVGSNRSDSFVAPRSTCYDETDRFPLF
jgi:hypothetical protein